MNGRLGIRILNRRSLDTHRQLRDLQLKVGPKGRFLEAIPRGYIPASVNRKDKTREIVSGEHPFPGNAETFSAPHQQEKAQEAEPLGVGDVSRSAVTLAHSTSSVVSVIRGDLPA